MNADAVFLLEGLPEHVHRVVKEDEGIEGVDALVGGDRRMGCLAMEDHLLVDEAGKGGVEREVVTALTHRVQMDEEVFLVEHSRCQHVDLAADIIDLAFSDQLLAKGDICELLGRREIEGHGAVFHDVLELYESVGHDGTLRGVAAAVGGIVFLVRKGMAKGRNGVEFGEQADVRRAGADRSLEGRPETEVSDLDAVFCQIIRQDLFIGIFLVAEFGMSEELISEFVQHICVCFKYLSHCFYPATKF